MILTLWILSMLARGVQMLLAVRMWFLFAWLLWSLCAEGFFLGMTLAGNNYAAFQQTTAPFGSCFRIAASLEAYAWLASRLPRFRSWAWTLLPVFIYAGWAVSGYTPGLAGLEVGVARGLVAFLGLTLVLHKGIGTEDSPAMWHAGLLSLAMAANGAGWYFMRQPLLGACLMFGGQMAASLLWCWKVWPNQPDWIEPGPTSTRREVTRWMERMRR